MNYNLRYKQLLSLHVSFFFLSSAVASRRPKNPTLTAFTEDLLVLSKNGNCSITQLLTTCQFHVFANRNEFRNVLLVASLDLTTGLSNGLNTLTANQKRKEKINIYIV